MTAPLSSCLDALRHEDAGKVGAGLDALDHVLGREGVRDAVRLLLRAVLGRPASAEEVVLELTAAAGRELAETRHRGPLRGVDDVRGAAAARFRRANDRLLRDVTDDDVDRTIEHLAAGYLHRVIEAHRARALRGGR